MVFDSMINSEPNRPAALVTDASRRSGITAAVALALARDGWHVATTCWRPYDAEMPLNSKCMLHNIGFMIH